MSRNTRGVSAQMESESSFRAKAPLTPVLGTFITTEERTTSNIGHHAGASPQRATQNKRSQPDLSKTLVLCSQFSSYCDHLHMTAFHQWYHGGRIQDVNWAPLKCNTAPASGCKGLKHDLADHMIDPDALKRVFFALIITLRERE